MPTNMGVRFGHVVRSGRGLGNGYVRTGPSLGDVLRESEPEKVYSSGFRATTVVFDKGKLTLEGRANYLMKPFPA
jgi:hypothetical protein